MKKLTFLLLAAAAMASCGNKPTTAFEVPLLEKSAFDTVVDGKSVSLYTIENENGMVAQFTNYGARLVALWVPAADGTFKDVVWGYESIAEYFASDDRYCGPVVGRYGNRIGKGFFMLDGKEYQLPINNGANHLHGGGPTGWSEKIWDVEEVTDMAGGKHIEMTLHSPNGDAGYPGAVDVKVDYSLNSNNELMIRYRATTDAATIVNPTSHAYFNLHGTSAESTNSHILKINATQYTPTDFGLIPTGELATVVGTPLDFRNPTRIGDRIDADFEALRFGKGYDHNYVLKERADGNVIEAAEVYEPATGIVMTVFTDQPGIQFYSGNFMDGKDIGKRGDVHNYRTGIALETQNYPDAPNHGNFPSARLEPGQTYNHTCVYAFSVRKGSESAK